MYFSPSLLVLGTPLVIFGCLNSYEESLTRKGSGRESVEVFSMSWDPWTSSCAREVCCPCLTWAHSEQKESKEKRLQLNCLQLCPSNWKGTTSSVSVNPSLRRKLMTNLPIYLRALKGAKIFHKAVVKQVSSWHISRLSCASAGVESDIKDSACLLGLHGKLVVTRQDIIKHC